MSALRRLEFTVKQILKMTKDRTDPLSVIMDNFAWDDLSWLKSTAMSTWELEVAMTNSSDALKLPSIALFEV